VTTPCQGGRLVPASRRGIAEPAYEIIATPTRLYRFHRIFRMNLYPARLRMP